MKTSVIITSIIIVAILMTSCMTSSANTLQETPVFTDTSLPTDQYLKLFEDFNSYSGSVVMGISGQVSDKDRAIGLATEEALRYLAFNKGLAMEVRYSKNIDTSGNLTRFGTLSGGGTSDSLLEECAKEMEIKNITWYGGKIGMAVFATAPGMKEVSVPSDWKKKTPVIEGWNLATGTVSAFGREMSDAIEGAIYRSAQALLDYDARSVNVDVTLEKTHSSGYSNSTFQISGNRFESFTVFALDYDPISGKVTALTGSRII